MSLKIDRVQLEIVIKNDKSRQQMMALENTIRSTKKEIAKLNRQGKQGTEEYIAATKKLKDAQIEYDKLFDKIGLAGLSTKELTKRQRELKVVLTNLSPNTAEYTKYANQLKAINTRMTELRNGTKQTKGAFARLADGFNKYGATIAGITAGLAGFIMMIKQFISGFAQTSDVMGEVMKTTGLAYDEVKKLKSGFKEFDTRTASNSLLQISKIAGKLGITGSENIRSFTKEANIMTVSLGKALGDNPEDTINTIGKVIGAFKLQDDMGWDKAMKHIGATINELGKRSTASEKPIVDYISRLSSVAVASEISVDKIAGIGAALDSLKVPAEQGSSSVMKFIYTLSDQKNIIKFSKMLGITTEQYKKMLKDDVNNTMIQVLKASKNGSKGLLEMTQSLDAADVSGVRMTATIGTLMNNIDVLTKQQKIASDEFAKGTSTMAEYAIMNDNFAGKMARANKEVSAIVFSFATKLEPIILAVTEGFVKFIKNIGTFIKIIAIATTAILSYKVASQLASITVSDLRNAIEKAKKAMKALNLTAKANVWGLVAAAVAAVIVAYIAFRDETETVSKKIQNFNSALVKEKAHLNTLFDTLKRTTEGTQARKTAVDQVNKVYGKYLPKLLTEKSTLEEIRTAQDAANKALIKNIALKTKQKDIEASTINTLEKQKINLNNIIDIIADEADAGIAAIASSEVRDITDKMQKNNITVKALGQEEFSKELDSYIQETAVLSQYIKKVSSDDIALGRASARNSMNLTSNLSGFVKEQMNLQDELQSINMFYDALIGDYGELSTDDASNNPEKKPVGNSNSSSGGSNTDKEKKETSPENYDKRLQEYEKFVAEIDAMHQSEAETQAEKDEEELEKIRQKYQDKIDIAIEKGEELEDYKQHIKELEDMQQEEEDAKIQEFEDRDHDAKQAMREEIQNLKLSEDQLEIQQTKNKYQSLIDEAKKHKISVVGLTKMMTDEVNRLNKISHANQLKGYSDTFTAIGGLFGAAGDDMKAFVLAKIAMDTAASISSLMAVSEANPLNTVTFGGAGMIQWIAGIARIIANVASAKQALSKSKQAEKGIYPVIGEDDNRIHNAKMISSPETGIYRGPMLISEYGDEAVVDHRTLISNQKDNLGMTPMNHLQAITAIKYNKAYPVPQMAEGNLQNYASTTTDASPSASVSDNSQNNEMQTALFSALLEEMRKPKKNYVVFQDVKDAEDTMNQIDEDSTL